MRRLIAGLIFPFLAIYFIWYWLLKCNKLIKLDWKNTFLVALLHEVACALCAKAMSFVEAGFVAEGATTYRLYGLMFFLPFYYLLLCKIFKLKKTVVFDVFAIAVIIRLVLGRIDCLIMGCCKGAPILFMDGARWPLREIELGYYLVMILLYARKILKRETYGQVYPIYLISYGSLRFMLEWVREEYVGNVGILHLAHVWSLTSIAAGAVWLCLLRKYQKHTRKKPGQSEINKTRRSKA